MEESSIQFGFDRKRNMFVEFLDEKPVRAWPYKDFGRYLSLAAELYVSVEMEKILPFLEGVSAEQEMKQEANELTSQIDAEMKQRASHPQVEDEKQG